MDTVSLDADLITSASSVVVSETADSSIVFEESWETLIAVTSYQVIELAVDLSIGAGTETKRDSGSAT